MYAMNPELKSHAPPRPSQWNISKAQMWLIDNPVVSAEECAFLFSVIEERIDAEERAVLEKSSVTEDLFNKKWLGKEPILQLIYTLVDNDEIKRAYLQHFDLPSDCMVIDCNTAESCAACCWMMMADKWNDPHFSPCTLLWVSCIQILLFLL